MARTGRNVIIGGRWYGPSYPDAGDPPRPTGKGSGAVSAPLSPPPAPPSAEPPPGPGPEPSSPDQAPLQVAESAGADVPAPPPRHGRGSTNAAWRTWADLAGVDLSAVGGQEASRDDVIDAAVAAGILQAPE